MLPLHPDWSSGIPPSSLLLGEEIELTNLGGCRPGGSGVGEVGMAGGVFIVLLPRTSVLKGPSRWPPVIPLDMPEAILTLTLVLSSLICEMATTHWLLLF